MPNITLVIQWRASCDLCTLWQRFGRAARDFALTAIALFLVEPMYFDETKEEKATRKTKRQEKAAEKAKKLLGKRKRSDDGNLSRLPGSESTSNAVSLRARFVSASFPTVNLTAQITTPASVPIDQTASPMQSEYEMSEDEEDVIDAVALQEERRVLYHGVEGPDAEKLTRKGKNRKKDGNELEASMDDVINAGSPGRCFKCFRAPANIYFENDKASKYLLYRAQSVSYSP